MRGWVEGSGNREGACPLEEATGDAGVGIGVEF